MRTTCGSRSSLACCRRCSLGDLLPAPAIALDAAARESLVPAASLRAHRPRHRCGHDGQRKRVAHMPTATTAEEDSSSNMVQNYPHDFTERQNTFTSMNGSPLAGVPPILTNPRSWAASGSYRYIVWRNSFIKK